MRNFPSLKGFTLIEVLLITVLLAILGLAALSAFTDSSETFTFLENYKNITASLRSTRVSAITNKIEDAERYGVLIQQKTIVGTDENLIELISFADTGTTSFAKDDDDEIMPSDSYTITGKYDIKLANDTKNSLPLLIFYHAGGEKMTVISAEDILPSESAPLVVLQFVDNEKDHEKYVGIFQVSGLIEEFAASPLLKNVNE